MLCFVCFRDSRLLWRCLAHALRRYGSEQWAYAGERGGGEGAFDRCGKVGTKKEEGNEQAPAVLLKSRQSLVVTTTIFLPVRPTVSCAFDGQCAAATARRAVRTQQRGSQHVARACTQLRRVVSAHRGVQPADAQNGHFR